jgi:phosphoenolpyruvate synthase/pyruvate phosphate dikinase
MSGVKMVWASLWNFDAYEARVRNYVDQEKVFMSALIQVGVDMERGGVMITKDPFDRESTDIVFISSVCGHNSNVVNNKGIPEQLVYRPDSDSISVVTLSDQTSALRFSAAGDMRQINDKCANAQGRVITDAQVRALSKIAMQIETAFGGVPQDLEWGMIGQRIYIVQTRPYIDGQ